MIYTLNHLSLSRRQIIFQENNAEGGSRTLTRGEPDGILNPARLPVPPHRPVHSPLIIDYFEEIVNCKTSGCRFVALRRQIWKDALQRPVETGGINDAY